MPKEYKCFSFADESSGSLHPALQRTLETPELIHLAKQLKLKLNWQSMCEPRKVSDSSAKLKEQLNFKHQKFLSSQILENKLEELILDFEIRQDSEPYAISREETQVKELPILIIQTSTVS